MADRLRKWFPVIFLMLLAGLSYWLENKVRLSAVHQEDAGHVPDAIVENLSATALGEDGKPRQLLVAKTMLHYADDSSEKLEDPSLLLLTPGKPDMRVTSKWAMLPQNGKDVYLHEDVSVVREPYGTQGQMVMTTDYLHVNPDQHVGDTPRPVRIRDKTMDVHAVGMNFNDETRVVNLLSHVHVHYEKKQ